MKTINGINLFLFPTLYKLYIYIEENLYDIELTSSLYRDCIVGFSDFVEHYSILLPKIWKEKSMF